MLLLRCSLDLGMPQETVGRLVAHAPEVGGAEAHRVNCTRTGRMLTLRGCA